MKNIVLVGFMATGKTSVARELAKRLNREYVSIDSLVEEQEKRAIKEIFAQSGEKYFRDVESKIIGQISDREGLIIDAGGGAVIEEENIKNLKRNGVLICLRASPEAILARTKHATQRPLLNVPEPAKIVHELLKIRESYYAKADYSIDTSNLSVNDVVEEIIKLMEKSC